MGGTFGPLFGPKVQEASAALEQNAHVHLLQEQQREGAHLQVAHTQGLEGKNNVSSTPAVCVSCLWGIGRVGSYHYILQKVQEPEDQEYAQSMMLFSLLFLRIYFAKKCAFFEFNYFNYTFFYQFVCKIFLPRF